MIAKRYLSEVCTSISSYVNCPARVTVIFALVSPVMDPYDSIFRNTSIPSIMRPNVTIFPLSQYVLVGQKKKLPFLNKFLMELVKPCLDLNMRLHMNMTNLWIPVCLPIRLVTPRVE